MFRRIATSALLLTVALAALAGCASGSGPSTSPSTAPSGSSTSPGSRTLEVYLVKGEVLTVVERHGEGVEDALKEMLSGPSRTEEEAGISTAIPADTTLLSYSALGGKAVADFSGEMLRYGGGSARVQAIMGQIDNTIRKNDPSVTAVSVTIEGKPAEEVLQP